MPTHRPPRRPALLLVLLLAATTLPSCLTQKVWEEPSSDQWAGEMSTATRIALTPAALTADAAICAAYLILLAGPGAIPHCR